MAITMMTSRESYEANPEGVQVVTNYPGHETAFINHAYHCPHTNSRRDTAKFADCIEGCKFMEPLYMRTTHVGLVLSLRERNGHDDSDFYATVWNVEKGYPEEIEYATTRGWSYPNGARIDATPEIVAAYEAFKARLAADRARTKTERDAKVPTRGRLVKVIRGRKIPIGTIGRVAWYGVNQFNAARNNRYRNPHAAALGLHDELYLVECGERRIKLVTNDGAETFTDAKNVEVIEL